MLHVRLIACVLTGVGALALSGCGGTDCGPGTTENDGECVITATDNIDDAPGDGNGGGVDALSCGDNEVAQGDVCIPISSLCAVGTAFNADSGLCEDPVDGNCGEGTTPMGDLCVPDFELVCGPGTAGDPVTESCVGSARVQVVHMSADPAAASVDVWVADQNGMNAVKLLEDFAFRTATPYLDLLPGTYDVRVLPSDSTSYDDTPVAGELQDLILAGGQTAQVVARGVLNPAQFDSTANGEIGFTLDVLGGAFEADPNLMDSQYKIRVLHAVSDARPVDTGLPFAGDTNVLAYGEETERYIDLTNNGVEPLVIDLEVQSADNVSVFEPLASFQTSVAGAFEASAGGVTADQVALVVASGFVNPMTNSGGAALDLHAVLPNGTVAALDRAALVQLIHAGAGIDSVDIYRVNSGDSIVLSGDPDDVDEPTTLDYLRATAFESVPAGVPFDLYVAAENEVDPQANAVIVATNTSFVPGSATRLVAIGEASAAPNAPTEPQLVVVPSRETPMDGSLASLQLFHAVPDAGAVDIFAELLNLGDPDPASRLADDATYGSTAGASPVDVAATSYVVTVTAGNETSPLAGVRSQLDFPLDEQAGRSFMALAIGYVSPPAGPFDSRDFGALVVDNDGRFRVLQTPSALQLYHASPDPAAATVDLVVNGQTITDVGYRQATPTYRAPRTVTVAVRAPGSTTDLFSEVLPLYSDLRAVAAVTGVVDPTGFDALPTPQNKGLDIEWQEVPADAESMGVVDLYVLHGSPDTAAVDLDLVSGGNTSLFDDVEFGDFVGFAELASGILANVDLEVNVGGNVTVLDEIPTLASYQGQSVVMVANGFSAEQRDGDGNLLTLPPLDFDAIAPDGTVIDLSP
ncbi:MAG: DUF4397 domain-containing protein [Myxococcota bacterium]